MEFKTFFSEDLTLLQGCLAAAGAKRPAVARQALKGARHYYNRMSSGRPPANDHVLAITGGNARPLLLWFLPVVVVESLLP